MLKYLNNIMHKKARPVLPDTRREELRFILPNTYADIYIALALYLKCRKTQRNAKIFGVYLIILSVINLISSGINIVPIILLTIGLPMIFFQKPLLQAYAYLEFKKEQLFCGSTKITATDEGMELAYRFDHYFVAWKQFRYVSGDNLLLLYRPWFCLILITQIPKRYLSEEDWEKLNALAKGKIETAIASRKKLSAKGKFAYVVLAALLVLVIQVNFNWLFVFLTQDFGLGLDPKVEKSTSFYVFVSIILLGMTVGWITESRPSRKKMTLFLSAFLIFLLVTFVGTVLFLPSKHVREAVRKEFSGNELLNAVNTKRKKVGRGVLTKNPWVCRVAALGLKDSVKHGQGKFASDQDYAEEIRKATLEYKQASHDEQEEPMPEFDLQYYVDAVNLELAMQWLTEDKTNERLFTNREIAYGCATAEKGLTLPISQFGVCSCGFLVYPP
jgi:hypothetical protein